MRRSRFVFLSILLVSATLLAGTKRELTPAPSAMAAVVANHESKIEAGLLMTLRDATLRERLTRVAKSSAGTPDRLFAVEPGNILPIFVETHDTAATKKAIEDAGGTVSTVVGNHLVAHVPLGRVEALAATAEVDRIEPSYFERATLDKSRTEVRADIVQAGTGFSQPFTGRNVIVGVFDSGIDWSHADFKDASGKTRIIDLWDLTQEGKPAPGTGRGYECTPSDINASTCPEKDTNGHGSHVAGIAAGNGLARSKTFVGMAPDADLLIVKGGNGSFSRTNIVDGVSYIFNRATALGKPAVVNLSLGGHSGGHDGTSSYEQSLTGLLGNGHLIVVANGNEGGDRIHVGYDAAGSSYETGVSTYWNVDSGSSSSFVDLWYSGTVSVGMVASVKSGGKLTAVFSTPGIPLGSSFNRTKVTAAGSAVGFVTIETEQTSGGKHAVISIDNNDDSTIDLTQVTWEVYTFGSGHVDGWVVSSGEFDSFNDPSNGFIGGDFNETVGMPATASNMIAVGSYTTKINWVDVDGKSRIYSHPNPVGQISAFSSLGPTRDGRRRPIVSAPGEAIASVLSSAVDITDAATRPYVLNGGNYLIEQGTSMAAPHVTGLVALMLQARPALNVNDAYAILRGKARKDSFTGTAANNTYGDGKVDAVAYVAEAVSSGAGAQPCVGNPTTLCLNASRYRVTLTAKDPSGKQGQGQPTQQSDLFGYFSLPALTNDATNPEVFVKTLGPVNGVPWVFYAGLTNLDYSLTVVDTLGTFNQTYHVAPPPAGSFQSFGNYDVAGATSSNCADVTKGSGFAPVTGCSTSNSTLCLLNRFAVTLQARDNPTRSNNSGPGLTVPVNSLFGFFTVPGLSSDPNDIQVFVKMVDARGFDGHFWVFLGGLTDFDLTLTVVDTQRGVSRIYNKPPGSTCGLNDTQAFTN